MPADFSIAEADAGDIDAIARFFWDAWSASGPDAPGWAGASEEVMAELTAPELLRARIGGPKHRMYLAWTDERIVGFAATRVENEARIELAGIVVLEAMAGRGIGTPLLYAAVEAAAGAGFAELTVKTETTNDRALGFYRARGFVDHRVTTEDVEGAPVDLVELTRTLG